MLVPKGKTAKVGFPRLDEEKDGQGATGEEKKVAGAVKAEAGKQVQLKAGKKNVIQLTVRRDVMTIAFLMKTAPDAEYPKFVLESDDGTFRVEKGPKDDLVKGNETLDLRFEGLRPGRRYRLTREDGSGAVEVLRESVRYEEIVDQPRRGPPPPDETRVEGVDGLGDDFRWREPEQQGGEP